MQTIVVPTDLGLKSVNALRWAAALAHPDARLIALHIVYGSFQQHQMDEEFRHHLSEAFPRDSEMQKRFEAIAERGEPSVAIIDYAHENDADLIVMGSSRKGNWFGRFVGNFIESTIQYAAAPVFAVPESCEPKSINKIAFAADLNEVDQAKVLETIRSIAKDVDGELAIVHVDIEGNKLILTSEDIEEHLHGIFNDVSHTHHIIRSTDVVQALSEFIKANGIDVLCTVGRKQGVLQRLLKKGVTASLVLDSQFPIIVVKG